MRDEEVIPVSSASPFSLRGRLARVVKYSMKLLAREDPRLPNAYLKYSLYQNGFRLVQG